MGLILNALASLGLQLQSHSMSSSLCAALTCAASMLSLSFFIASATGVGERSNDASGGGTAKAKVKKVPLSVNFHFTRVCNYSCGFCFHTAKTSHMAPIADAKKAIDMLVKAGMRKINFAGGEPLMYKDHLQALLEHCETHRPRLSVSIITNGSRLTRDFISENAQRIDVLAVSVDSFDDETNVRIGRSQAGGRGMVRVEDLEDFARWCREFGIKFKLNTVVNALNWKENMLPVIERLNPHRWKIFQVLIIETENTGTTSVKQNTKRGRNAKSLSVTSEQFQEFLSRNRHPSAVPEPNDLMRDSYLILDEYLRFLDCSAGGKVPGPSVLDVGVVEALASAGWDDAKFVERGGIYDWSRTGDGGGPDCGDAALQW